MEPVERMEDFFTARLDLYEDHMLSNVRGIEEAYQRMANLLPENAATLLDLGCGTGLELASIFQRFPNLQVTGIDRTQAMLDKLRQKYADRHITLICEDYCTADFGENRFNAAVSFQTLHHLSHEEKRGVYGKIRRSLRAGGMYVEADYTVNTQAEEDELFAARERFLHDHLGENETVDAKAYHIDVPCTVENLVKLMKDAGFANVRQDRAWENMAILVAMV